MALENKCDVHTHTNFSRHAYSTIEENVRAASAMGLELLGNADHFSLMLYGENPQIRDYQFFLNQSVWPRTWMGVTLLRAMEADIVDIDGHLFGMDTIAHEHITGGKFDNPCSMYEHLVKHLDYVVASVHNNQFTANTTVAQNTQMYIDVIQQPKVFILGHPGRSGVEFDHKAVFEAARDNHVAIEINECTFKRNEGIHVCTRMAEECAQWGVPIAISTDAHISPTIGHFRNTLSMLESIHFPEELIITKNRSSFLHALDNAGLSIETE